MKPVTLEGYTISSKPHLDGCRGGGIGLVYNKESVTPSDTSTFEFREAECSLFKVRVDHVQLDLFVLYRYPEGNVLAFFEDLSNVLKRIVISLHELVILGDFNIGTDLQDTVETITYSDLLDLYNLKNHVTFPTHNKDHTLDLVLTDNECTMMAEVTQGDFISDHCMINCKLNIAKLQNDTLWRYCQKIKKMDKDLKASLPLISQEPSVDAKTDKYHTILDSIMDKLAPLKRKG